MQRLLRLGSRELPTVHLSYASSLLLNMSSANKTATYGLQSPSSSHNKGKKVQVSIFLYCTYALVCSDYNVSVAEARHSGKSGFDARAAHETSFEASPT